MKCTLKIETLRPEGLAILRLIIDVAEDSATKGDLRIEVNRSESDPRKYVSLTDLLTFARANDINEQNARSMWHALLCEQSLANWGYRLSTCPATLTVRHRDGMERIAYLDSLSEREAKSLIKVAHLWEIEVESLRTAAQIILPHGFARFKKTLCSLLELWVESLNDTHP